MTDDKARTFESTDMRAPAKRRGNFFAVDLETYQAVCALGDPDVAASYLILAAGTGADNRTTTWSREAINERTSLNWRRARDCVDKLVEAGFAVWTRRGARPRMDLRPIDRVLQPLSPVAKAMVELVRDGGQPVGQSQKAGAARARDLGYLTMAADGSYTLPAPRKLQMVWMPKELVDGAVGERPPVERVRRARDAQAFRLLVDLYSIQDLAEHGGIERRHLQRKFSRETASATGQYQLWSFRYDNEYVSWSDPLRAHRREPTAEEVKQGKNAAVDFFDRLGVLKDAGLIEWVYYLAEDDSDDAMLIHPVAVERQGGLDWAAFESVVGNFAIRAALALHSDADYKTEDCAKLFEEYAPKHFLLAAERLLRKVQLFGVPRLRYRAKTTNSIRWLDDLLTGGRAYIEGYRELIKENCPDLLATADRRLADFNDGSTLVQRRAQCDINDSSQSASSASVPNGTAGPDDRSWSSWYDRAANEG